MSEVCTLPPVHMGQFEVRYDGWKKRFYLEVWVYKHGTYYQPQFAAWL